MTDKRPEDDLDALMRTLSDENPEFGTLLVETGKELAPLASAEDGSPTLTSLRMSAGYTQTELAKVIGQKQSNVSLMESGQRLNIQRDTMKRMCTALGCDMSTLDAALDATEAMLQKRLAKQEANSPDTPLKRCA